MSSSQFNITYLPQEDRLLLQLNSDNEDAFQFLLTRRLTIQLMNGFEQLLEQANVIKREKIVTQSPEAKQAIKQFEHEGALAKADFKTPFSEQVKARPLGEQAILLHTIQLTIVNEGQVNVKFMLDEKKSLDILLNYESVHAIYHIFAQSVGSAQWDIPLHQFATASNQQGGHRSVN